MDTYEAVNFYLANSPVWLGGSILSFYISDYTSRKTFIIIKADVSAPMQVPFSVQMTKTDKTVV